MINEHPQTSVDSEQLIQAERQQNQILLRDFIISRGGRISFDEYMAFSLYDPDNGYYQKRAKIGNHHEKPDFVTYADSPIFARAVIHFAKQNSSGDMRFVELAGGEGKFKANAQQFIGTEGMSHYLSVDISAKLVEMQQSKGGEAVQAPAYRLPFASKSIDGVIFANELIDALPHKVFRLRMEWDDVRRDFKYERVEELYYSVSDDGDVVETWDEPTPETTKYWDSARRYLAERGSHLDSVKDKTEISFPPSAELVISECTRVLKNGKIILADYGDLFETYINRGLLLRQYPHRNSVPLERIHERVFENDITADVDFSNLVGCARRCGASSELFSLSDFCDLQTTADDIKRLGTDEDFKTQWSIWHKTGINPLKSGSGWYVLVINVEEDELQVEKNPAQSSGETGTSLITRLRKRFFPY